MSKYKGLFTFDVENHRYLPVEQADGLIAEMDYHPEQEPLIKDEKIRKAVRAWAEANGLDSLPIYYSSNYNRFCDDKEFSIAMSFYREVEGGLIGGHSYYLDELCGEDEGWRLAKK